MERDTTRTEAPRERPEPYLPPAVEWEEPFDPIADSCDPLNPDRPEWCPPI